MLQAHESLELQARESPVLQAHESPVRSMQYAHNENWLLTGEDDGKLKYWKPNLECVKVVHWNDACIQGIVLLSDTIMFMIDNVTIHRRLYLLPFWCFI